MNDLIGGHIDFFCEQSVSVAEQVKSGTIKAYGVSAAERLASLPEVPAAKEFGVNYLMSIWAGIFAPKGTPPDVVAKLAGALDKALDDDGVKQRINNLGGSIPEKSRAQPRRVRRLREIGDRTLGAGVEGGGRACEVAASQSPIRSL